MKKPMNQPGRKVLKLAKMLQVAFPDRNGRPVIWRAEEIYPAKGAWRTNVNLDVWRWEAFAHYVEPDGKDGGCAYNFGSYGTITELTSFKFLYRLGSDEVEGTNKEPAVMEAGIPA